MSQSPPPAAEPDLLMFPFAMTGAERRRELLSPPEQLSPSELRVLSLGLFALVFGFSNAETHGWGATATVVALIASPLLLTAFVLIERRIEHPLMPLHIVWDRARGGRTPRSIGTSLLSTIYASAVTGYLATHLHLRGLASTAQVHGETTAFWWAAGIFALGFVLALVILPSRCEARTATTLTALARHAIGNCNHDHSADGAAVTDRAGSPEPALAP